MARKFWRCFHCDQVFHSRKWAAEHFGYQQDAEPACKIASHQEHLITYIRELEGELAQYRQEDSHVLRSMMTLQADHRTALVRAEETGYERGVAAMKVQGFCVEPEKHEPHFKIDSDGYRVEQVSR